MIEAIHILIDQAAQHTVLLMLSVFIGAVIDSALGLGVVLPGETVLVFAAVALADDIPILGIAILVAAVGALVGDHLGFGIGRLANDRLENSRLIKRVGHDRWISAQRFVSGRFWAIIVGRLLPGIRTFISVAAGTSAMPYHRFVLAASISALLWATMWVGGGAILGHLLLKIVERFTVPVIGVCIVIALTMILVRRHRRKYPAHK